MRITSEIPKAGKGIRCMTNQIHPYRAVQRMDVFHILNKAEVSKRPTKLSRGNVAISLAILTFNNKKKHVQLNWQRISS